jgi:hypothetical protein
MREDSGVAMETASFWKGVKGFNMNTPEENLLILRCHEIFKYDPDSGLLTRIKRQGMRGKVGDVITCLDHAGYVKVKIDTVTYLAHRLIFGMVYCYFPEHIDHINRVRNDNRLVNLRASSPQTNPLNRTVGKDNTSGVNGVTWDKTKMRWLVQIQVNYEHKRLGYYESFEEAKAVRLQAEKQMFGEFARQDGGEK